jgi:hypothetical protein
MGRADHGLGAAGRARAVPGQGRRPDAAGEAAQEAGLSPVGAEGAPQPVVAPRPAAEGGDVDAGSRRGLAEGVAPAACLQGPLDGLPAAGVLRQRAAQLGYRVGGMLLHLGCEQNQR